ncbi:MAG: hypothetical protein CGU28_15260 [Candidatus Dactylopiibacterium carminicum]|uniref:CidA/LrgA family protein n=1 Tax=Candidatus Dactylopiibacterium carminicum TaxID=857335 RepID=A0A272EW31_9RHOO|nr:CidA/LrgA family protein [Candidatus Dactylopiibacterium carminicum]PAS93343.1 MAG: hypothetical protein CGU28_15260 [Candidatus Dactylopiibacterium carminicum]PAS93860.1 MAG: hypothetical protein CGU29_06325 [Candidatus Dactylopiibacterium carminicum]
MKVLAQILLLVLVWWLVSSLSSILPQLPPTVLGIALLLALLGLRVLPTDWLAAGAGFLLREMLLFFIPVVVAVVQYLDLLRSNLPAVLTVILLSTLCVMLVTAWVVDFTWKLEARWRRDEEC